MTMLSDLKLGDTIVVMGQVSAEDPTAGVTLSLLGPDNTANGTLIIAPAGTFSGQLAGAATATPVQLVPALAAVNVGDVLTDNRTGETMVARRVTLGTDGTYQWSPSMSAPVWYTTANWTRSGTATLTS